MVWKVVPAVPARADRLSCLLISVYAGVAIQRHAADSALLSKSGEGYSFPFRPTIDCIADAETAETTDSSRPVTGVFCG